MGKGPGRVRTGTNKKGKRWRKGQSCLTNPDVKTFRSEAAKTRMFTTFPTANKSSNSGLTAKALAQLNDNSDDIRMRDDLETGSVGGESSKTFLSGVTDCTNATFNVVKRYWESQSASQKEVCAVLAAITEVIRENGGKETETEYFAALMSSLDTLDNDESVAASLFLLSLTIKKVPVSVLKLKFSVICKTLIDLLSRYASSQGTSLVKSILSCLGHLLRSQDAAVWSNSSTLQTYHGILSFTTNPKPKIRKGAQNAVCAILKASTCMEGDNPVMHHPAAAATAKYCIQEIETHGGTGDATSTCHVLELLKSVMVTFPKASLKETCETILKVMTLSNVVVTSVAMQALHSMFTSNPQVSSFPSDLNAKLINALYDFQPGDNDVQPMQAWLAVMEAAHVNLYKSDGNLCLGHLPRLFKSCMICLQSDKAEVVLAGSQVMKTLLTECVGPALSPSSSNSASSVKKIFALVETGLAYKYHASWGVVLQVLGVFFKVAGKSGFSYMQKCLQSMCDLRSTHQFPFTGELDRSVGEAVEAMGPSRLLEAVPLQITGKEDNYDFPRSWLLPIIRDHVCNTELQFFTRYFLPLAAKLKTRSLELTEQGRDVEAKTYDILQFQIWSMLPGFCKSPTDVKSGFKGIARILGSALTDRPDLRSDVCAGLRNIVKSNLENDENRAEIGKFAKNYLPILFNLYTTKTEESGRPEATVHETIKVYLQITDAQLLTDLTKKVCEKMKSSEEKQVPALMDLLVAMVPHTSAELIGQIFAAVTPKIQSMNHIIQKKSYRILEEICCGESAACIKFIESHTSELEQVLVKSVSSASPSSKAPRLKCLLHVVKKLPSGKDDFIEAIVPEVILCTKELNSKARGSAFLLLVEIGNTLVRTSDGSKQATINNYLGMLAAGLAGTPQMVSGTVLAFTRVIYEFKDSLEGYLLSHIIETVRVLLQSKGREIIRSALGLVKVLASVIEDVTLAQHVETLVTSIGGLSEVNSRSLRVPIKSIYKKLMKKFGYEMIFKMVSTHHQKMVHNLKKLEDRTRRRKTAKEEDEDEDANEMDAALMPSKPKPESIEDILQETDSEDEEDGKSQKRVKGQRSKKAVRGSTWLKENDQEEPLDFLDPGVSKRVLATRPENKPKVSNIKHDFKSMPDGRLVITEPTGEDETVGKKGAKRSKKSDQGDELDQLMDEALASRKKSSMKRKKDDMDSSDDEAEVKTKYQVGGIGIHRPMGGAAKKPGAEFKAKKAGGDMKKKGKPDPFAYIPLSRHQLNRRNKKKAAGQWKFATQSNKKRTMKNVMGKGHKKRK